MRPLISYHTYNGQMEANNAVPSEITWFKQIPVPQDDSSPTFRAHLRVLEMLRRGTYATTSPRLTIAAHKHTSASTDLQVQAVASTTWFQVPPSPRQWMERQSRQGLMCAPILLYRRDTQSTPEMFS